MKNRRKTFETDAATALSRELSSGYYTEEGFYRKGKSRSRSYGKNKQRQPSNGVPKGYDPDIWRLADGFYRASLHWGHTPMKGIPVIYLELKQRLDRDKEIMYFSNWQRLVERMIEDFWNIYLHKDDNDMALAMFISSPLWEKNRDHLIEAARMKRLKERVKARRASERSEATDHEGSGSAGH